MLEIVIVIVIGKIKYNCNLIVIDINVIDACLQRFTLVSAAKDVTSLSPAESMAAYNHYSRKQKYHWKSKQLRHAAAGMDQSADSTSGSQGTVGGSWSVSGTSQWQYPTDVIVNTASDLRHLQQFLVGKVCFRCNVCLFIYLLFITTFCCV